MKNRKKFKLLAIILAAALLLPALQTIAALPDIVVVSATSSVPAVTEGSEFNLQITFKNNTAQDLSGMMLDFSSADDVTVKTGGSSVFLPGGTVEAGASVSVTVQLRYTGSAGNDRIPVKFIYTYPDESSGETLAYVYVNAVATTTPGPMPDTSKYKAVLQAEIISGAIIGAGTSAEYLVRIKNLNTIYAARNVMLNAQTAQNSGIANASFPGTGIIAEIKPGEYTDVILRVSADKYAPSGFAQVSVSITYANIWNDEFTDEFSLGVEVYNPNSPAVIVIDNLRLAPEEIVSGSDFTLTVRVTNKGTYTAKNISITPDSLSSDTFMLSFGSETFVIASLEGGQSTDVSFYLTPSTNLKSGSHPLRFAIKYTDEKQQAYSESRQVWIPVEGSAPSAPGMMFVSVTPSKTKLGPSGEFTVKVTIKNEGTQAASQVKLSSETNSSSLYPVQQDSFYIQTIQPGESKSYTFGFKAQETASKGGTPVTFRLESSDGKGGTAQLEQSLFVFTSGPSETEDPGKNVPKIIINSYSTEPGTVNAGDRFSLNIEFLNTHSTKAIYNIKASFNVTESSSETGNVFSPVDSSNTLFIDTISPKDSISRNINLYTITDAKSKTYTVTFTFEYQDETGNPIKSEEIIGIPVYQPSRFEISEPYLPTEVTLGQPLYMYFEMYNLGKNALYNVKLRVEGMDSEPKNAYYGNFESGHNEYVELNLMPNTPGMIDVRIIATYESASGELSESVREFSLNVIEYIPPDDGGGEWPGPDDGGEFPPEEEITGFFGSLLFKLLAALLILVIAGAVVLIVRKKRRGEKEIEI